jgi:O-antigen/teichoic acid export membrane protein
MSGRATNSEKGGRSPFDDVDMSGSVRGRAVSGGMTTVAAQVFKFVLNLGGMMVLGRLLDPKDFGMLGMVLGITGFLAMFTDLGLSTATVQSDEITNAQASNLFWINVGLSLVMGLLALALAPAIAWFYRDPRLAGLAVALSISFPLTGLAYQHRAILNRQMKFTRLALIDVGGMVLGMATACAMAFAGCGYWSLVALQVVTAAGSLAITLCLTRWIPGRPSRAGNAAHLLKFGFELSASNFVYYIARGLDTVLLGRFWGEEVTGYYTRAMALLVRPIDQVLSPISSVMLPLLGRLRHEPSRYRRVFLQVYHALGLIFFPMSAIFLVASRPLVVVILGAKWEASAPLFAGLTLAMLYIPYASASVWIFTSQGRGRDQLIQSVILNSLLAVSFIMGVRGGALSLVLWYSISGLAGRIPLMFYLVGRKGPISGWDLGWGMLIHVPLWIASYAGAWLGVQVSRQLPPIGQLAVILSSGACCACLFIAALKPQRTSAKLVLSSIVQVFAEKRRSLRAAIAVPANV